MRFSEYNFIGLQKIVNPQNILHNSLMSKTACILNCWICSLKGGKFSSRLPTRNSGRFFSSDHQKPSFNFCSECIHDKFLSFNVSLAWYLNIFPCLSFYFKLLLNNNHIFRNTAHYFLIYSGTANLHCFLGKLIHLFPH